MEGPAAQRERIVERLRELIDMHGKSVSSIEKDLGWSRGYLADAMRGGKRFPMETFLEVLHHLGIDFEGFLAGPTAEEARWSRYPKSAEPPSMPGQVAETHEPPGAAGFGPSQEEAPSVLRALIRLLVEKKVVDLEELLAEMTRRPPEPPEDS